MTGRYFIPFAYVWCPTDTTSIFVTKILTNDSHPKQKTSVKNALFIFHYNSLQSVERLHFTSSVSVYHKNHSQYHTLLSANNPERNIFYFSLTIKYQTHSSSHSNITEFQMTFFFIDYPTLPISFYLFIPSQLFFPHL